MVGRPLLSYAFQNLADMYASSEGTCYLTVNKKYERDFVNFLECERPQFSVELVVEPSTSDRGKLGTIGAIANIFDSVLRKKAADGLLVVAGDSISSFDIKKFAACFSEEPERSLVGLYGIKDIKKASEYGCAKVKNIGRRAVEIIEFKEKSAKPSSTLVNTTYFALREEDLRRLDEYVEKVGRGGKKGFIDWLLEQRVAVNGFVFGGTDDYWFDIGSHRSLAEANRFMREHR